MDFFREHLLSIVTYTPLAGALLLMLPVFRGKDDAVRWAFVAGIALFPVTLIIAWCFEQPWTKYTGSRLAIDAVVIAAIAITAGGWALRNLPQVLHTKTSIVILPFEHTGEPLEQSVSRALAYEINSLLMKQCVGCCDLARIPNSAYIYRQLAERRRDAGEIAAADTLFQEACLLQPTSTLPNCS